MPDEFLNDTESVRVYLDKVVMKTTNVTCLDQSERAVSDGFCLPKVIDTDTLAKTRKLLNSAIVSAWHAVKTER